MSRGWPALKAAFSMKPHMFFAVPQPCIVLASTEKVLSVIFTLREPQRQWSQ